MAEFRADQAAGLRRLLVQDRMRVVTFTAGCRGAGASTCVVNVAAALAASGRQVLVVDAAGGTTGVTALLGVRPRFDLRQAVRRECVLDDVLITAGHGITVLPAVQGAQGLPALRHLEEQHLLDHLPRLGEHHDIVLVDSRDRRLRGLLGRASNDFVLVVTATASALTGAYGLIKSSADWHANKRFHVLANGVGEAPVAQLVCRNLRRCALRYLDVPLADLGWVPKDHALREAAAAKRPVISAFPDAPSSAAFERIAASIAEWPPQHAAASVPPPPFRARKESAHAGI